ncbi:MAG: glycoside hydrolase family 2 TIM barrel-domain containing protein [Bacteroidota bacterium]
MKVKLSLLVFFLGLSYTLLAQQTEVRYLSGTDKDHTVAWDFFCSKGMNSGKWTTIAVPSNWEQQGFGGYSYGHDKVKTDETGRYIHSFRVPLNWKRKKVFIVFEGSMTDTEVKINGILAGPIHQGGFYRFKYDISELVRPGKNNLLEVLVSKQSANKSVNRAERDGDFWALGGIFRPVYLEALPPVYIDRVAINAKADGSLSVDVFGKDIVPGNSIVAQVQDLSGKNVGDFFEQAISTVQEKYVLKQRFNKPALWNPEYPALYQLNISLKDKEGILHSISQKFGFRTVELRAADGIYVNGVKVMFKGVNRHSSWPETGRTLSKEISLLDISLMKEMNMNAVRMSHYPPDQHFLDACDSLGLFVLDELTGWQAAYDTIAGRPLVKELVIRDVNHPCVILWANGNEGGWNRALDNDFRLYDPQERLVYHPWEKFNGTDTKHYPDFNYLVNSSLYSNQVYFPTEFMHGLYDGGHGAGLDDFWNAMLLHPSGAGGFLWSFHDEGIMRKDKKDSLDTDGNHAPDGIVGPHREKEASFYTIKEIWSPIHIRQKKIGTGFNDSIAVENRYLYTNLSACTFTWKLVKLPVARDTATLPVIKTTGSASLALAPGQTGLLQLNLPADYLVNDALYLTAFDPYKKEIYTWSWSLQTPKTIVEKSLPVLAVSPVQTKEVAGNLVVSFGSIEYYFNLANGHLSKVINEVATISLSDGPVSSNSTQVLKEIKHYQQGVQYIVEPVYQGKDYYAVKWIFTPGQPVQLQYAFSQNGAADCIGISFNYPEEKITGMKWMGNGPYRVWKNRVKGQQFGTWQKKYNNTITGESRNYPEFKGFHSNLFWVQVQNSEAAFTVYTDQENLFLQMLHPAKPNGAGNNNVSPPFAAGNIAFLQAITPIGTKFQAADKMGPQSQQNMQLGYTPFSGNLWFDFSHH